MPEQADQPPSDQLGLDAEGSAGSDAFGLAGNKGGRALLSGGGSAEAWYKRMLGQELQALINDHDELRKRAFSSLRVKIWIDAGRIQRVELLTPSGDKEWDRKLKTVFMNERLQTPPPPGIEQPVRLQISSRS
jgi:protein TonB